jgi:hypothetical protein
MFHIGSHELGEVGLKELAALGIVGLYVYYSG